MNGRLDQFSARNPMVFLHIPRTGGTSLLSYLDGLFAENGVCPAHEQFEFERLRELGKLSHYAFYRGHVGINFGREISPGAAWITMLRRPQARVYSTYKHMRAQSMPFAEAAANAGVARIRGDVALAKATGFDEFCREIVGQGRISFFNQMTVLLGLGRGWDLPATSIPVPDAAMLERAQEALRRFMFVGITEEFDRSCALLQDTLGIDRATGRTVPHVNATETGEPSDVGAARLRELTSFDEALYDFGRDLFLKRLNGAR